MRNRIVRGIRKVVDLPIGLGSRRWRPTGESPLVTIVVASYNYQDLIRETLDSLLAQTYANFEVLVVDDGSRDNSVQVIQEYCRRDSRIRLLQHPGGVNRGLASTLHLGADNARGEYTAFCESDDMWTPGHLAAKVELIRHYSDVAIASNGVRVIGDTECLDRFESYFRSLRRYLYPGGCYADTANRPRRNLIPTFSCVMIRTDLLRRCNFDTPVPTWADMWIYRQILIAHPLFHIPDQLTLWRQHADSYNGDRENSLNQQIDNFVAKSNQLLGIGR